MTKREATKARIALITRLLQWNIGTLIAVASGTLGLLVSKPETLDTRTFNVLFYGGWALSVVFIVSAAGLLLWALRNINKLEDL